MAIGRDRRVKEIDFEAEHQRFVDHIHSLLGQKVPLSCRYTRGEQATLISIEGDTATIRFRNGSTLSQVPIRDLVDDRGYWR